MENLSFRVILHLFLILLCSTSLIGQSDILWSKTYGSTNSEGAWKVINSGDQIILVGSSDSDDFGDQHETVRKGIICFLDLDGELQNVKAYSASERNYLWDIVEVNNGFIAAGIKQNGLDPINNIPIYNYWVLKIDKEGNEIWTRNFGGSKGEFLVNIHKVNETEFILVGEAQSEDGDVSSPQDGSLWVLKIDHNGNLLWDKSYGNNYNSLLSQSIMLSNGNIMLGAYIWEPGESGDFALIEIDSNGNIVWSNEAGGDDNDFVFDLAEAPNGDIIIIGESDSESTEFPLGKSIIRFDKSGNITWAIPIADSLIAPVPTIPRINVRPDGKIDLFSTSGFNGGFHDVSITTFDSNGKEIGRAKYGGTRDEGVRSIAQVNGGYLVAGYSGSSDGDVLNNSGEGDMWLFKLGIPSLTTNTTDPVKVDFEVFPNPFLDNVSIKSKDENINSLTIYNQFGMVILEKKNFKTVEVNTSKFGKGVYYIKLEFDNATFTKELVKVK